MVFDISGQNSLYSLCLFQLLRLSEHIEGAARDNTSPGYYCEKCKKSFSTSNFSDNERFETLHVATCPGTGE